MQTLQGNDAPHRKFKMMSEADKSQAYPYDDVGGSRHPWLKCMSNSSLQIGIHGSGIQLVLQQERQAPLQVEIEPRVLSVAVIIEVLPAPQTHRLCNACFGVLVIGDCLRDGNPKLLGISLRFLEFFFLPSALFFAIAADRLAHDGARLNARRPRPRHRQDTRSVCCEDRRLEDAVQLKAPMKVSTTCQRIRIRRACSATQAIGRLSSIMDD